MPNPPVATVDVHSSSPQIEYSRQIFGQFIEHFHRQVYGGIFEPGSPLSDESGFRLDVLEALKELKVPNVRWPGGCFVSAYHWVNGIGPERTPMYDPAWRVIDPNTFGTDEFLRWCELLGADAYICTNAGTGTPEEMADWVEYANRPAGSKWSNQRRDNGRTEPYGVPFWSIGNENYGDWEMGAKTGPEWASFVTESAKIMLRHDPSIQLLAAAVEHVDWVLPMLQSAGKYLTYMSIHGYWDKISEVNDPSNYIRSMARTIEPERQISLARAMIETSGQNHVKIAFDEWNLRGWHHPVGNTPEAIAARDKNDINSTYTMADAVFSATFLNSCLRNADKVGMANLAPTVNTRGPLFVHEHGIVKRTTFHVMAMYASLLGDRVAATDVTSAGLDTGDVEVPLIDAIATTTAEGRTVVVLVNKSEHDAADVRVRIDGQAISGSHDATVLDGPHADAYNDIDTPDAVAPRQMSLAFRDGIVSVPAHSVTVVTVEGTTARTPDGAWFVGPHGIRRV